MTIALYLLMFAQPVNAQIIGGATLSLAGVVVHTILHSQKKDAKTT
jgi:hypothetical protein